jgi:hypothetical protein
MRKQERRKKVDTKMSNATKSEAAQWAIQSGNALGQVAAEKGAEVTAEKPAARKGAGKKKGQPKARRAAKEAKPKASAPKKEAKAGKKAAKAKEPRKPRSESKTAKILDMIRRPKGATLAEIMKAADWQAHSVRGFISTAGKKHGITIESAKNDAGDRTYRIA